MASSATRLSLGVAFGVMLSACQTPYDPSHNVHETVRHVARSSGRDGLMGMTLEGATVSKSDESSVNLVPSANANSIRVIITYKPLAELIYSDSVSGDEDDNSKETWVFTASSVSLTASEKTEGNVKVAFENATKYPGIAGAENQIGPYWMDIPTLWFR